MPMTIMIIAKMKRPSLMIATRIELTLRLKLPKGHNLSPSAWRMMSIGLIFGVILCESPHSHMEQYAQQENYSDAM